MISRRHSLLALAVAALSATPLRAENKLPVVATFSILGDLVRQVGGDRVSVTVLVGPGGDAHVYSPTPQDAKALAGARLIVANGLKFEGWIDRLVQSSGAKGPVVFASAGVTTQPVRAAGHSHRGDDHAGRVDPHAWQSIANARVYVANIRDGLAAADPVGRTGYEGRAVAYLARLDALEREVTAKLAALPKDSRKVVTSHDAFGYFASAYGLTVLAPRGLSTEAEPSAKQVGELIRQIQREKVRAVFVESISDRRSMERIAKETGAVVGGALYSDSLSPLGGPATTYEAMMRHNVDTLVKALAPQS